MKIEEMKREISEHNNNFGSDGNEEEFQDVGRENDNSSRKNEQLSSDDSGSDGSPDPLPRGK